MRAQDKSSINLVQNEKSKNNISNNSNKGKIQILRQRKSELEKLLGEKNQLLQHIQKQEAQIIGSEWLSPILRNKTAGGDDFDNDNQQQYQLYSNLNPQNTTSTLRRKVGSSFKLPRINKKEYQNDIENLLLEKKLQQEICNASFKLANDLTLAKSVRRNRKAEYESAQQKLSVINQNLNVLKKRQLRSHSTSLSESSSIHKSINTATVMGGGITGNGGMSTLKMKSPPQLPVSQSSTIALTNLGSGVNYSLSSNSIDSALLMPSKKSNNLTTMNSYISSTITNNNVPTKMIISNNSNSGNNNRNHSNNYSPNARRNSVKSVILTSSSKCDSSSPSSGSIQHFDRTLKNHRSDYDINRIVPSPHQIDKYQFSDGFTNDNRISGSYSLGGRTDSDLSWRNTLPIQQLPYKKNHHGVIDCDLSQQEQVLSTESLSSGGGVCVHDNEFEIINNRNRTSGNFEKSSLLSPHTKDGRLSEQYAQTLYNHENSTNMNFYHPVDNVNTVSNEYTTLNQSSCSDSDWKQNTKYDTFDTVSLYPMSSSLNQQLSQQTGLGGFWKTLPNNERIWYSTANDNFIDGRKLISETQFLTHHRIQQIPLPSNISDNSISQTIKDEISDKISISSINSETNKRSREKQWLETSLDTPIAHSKHSTTSSSSNSQQQHINSRPQYLYHHHHYYDSSNSSNVLSPSTLQSSITKQCNLKTISDPIYSTTVNYKLSSGSSFKDRPKLSSQSMSNKIYQRSTTQRLEDQSRLSHSTSVLNKQYVENHQQHHLKKLQSPNGDRSMSATTISNENNALYFHSINIHESTKQLVQLNNNQQQILPSPLSFSTARRDANYSTSIGEIELPSAEPSMSSYTYPSSISSSTAIIGSQNNNNNVYKNFGSILMTNISKAQEIRVESPKNMTVIQKAVFVPYKEVTKPFEMSDFYKYSTKFRQKDQQQQQQNNNDARHQHQKLLNNTTSSIIATANNNCEARNTTVVVEQVK